MTQGVAPGTRFCAGPSNPDYTTGANELPVQRALARVLREGMVFFDVGANVGFFTVLAARAVGSPGRVVAFEPVAENAAYARLNCRLNQLHNVLVLEQAVGQTSGISKLQLARYSGGSSLEVAGPPPDFTGTRTVRVVSLDDLLERSALPVPHVVKIDVEGAELDVLHGMEKVLRKWTPTIILELDDATAAACERKVSSCQAFLQDLGYRIEPLPNAYPDGRWFVQHFLAVGGAPQSGKPSRT